MKKTRNVIRPILVGSCSLMLASLANAAVFTVTVDGTDAIFLAGRTDLTIPDPADPWTGPNDYLVRHLGATPEEAQESLPPSIAVAAGDVIKVADPASGGINFFNGNAGGFFGPSGNSTNTSSQLSALGGISGYIGRQGALVGVFLGAGVPVSLPPATLDFGVIGLDFLSLSPELGQVFYIGDGVTSSGDFQEFIAPTDATRLFLGIPDGFNFIGPPGAYDDNDGAYRINVGVNEDPPKTVPDAGSTFAILGLGIGLLALFRRHRKQ